MNNVKSALSSSNKGTSSESNPSTGSGKGDSEQSFSIQPHPAKTNDPADLQPSGGLRQGGAMDAFHARDPYVPSEQIRNNMPAPLSRDELHAKQASLNADNQ
ncbi:hypothetical protein B0H34DRAFT_662461 [Crassisporium funariophilum]|nr:hypothetical protein B0H34DRAFT_662461 [Crassisporium funariophilum]